MRSIVASLIMFLLLAVVVLVVALLASLGVSGIGWIVAQLFNLTQWQGTIVALVVSMGAGFLVYQLGGRPGPVVTPFDFEDWEEEYEEPEEPPVVAWRQRRPTPGDLPAQTHAKGKRTPRK